MTSLDSRMPDVLKRDRTILLAALAGLAALAWAYLLNMDSMGGAGHAGHFEPNARPWSAWDFAAAAGLWGVMMMAMMLPVASPSLLALSQAARQRDPHAAPLAGAAGFLAGYGIAWLAFSLLAAAAQLALQRPALLSGQWSLSSPVLASILLAVAGIYQWTPLREACLKRCRSPMGMFLASWDDSRWGSLRMGIRHGAWCVGCCWALMALSFVFGVMNLAWMAFAAAYLLLERIVPAEPWLSRGAGVLLIAGAIWTLFGGPSP